MSQDPLETALPPGGLRVRPIGFPASFARELACFSWHRIGSAQRARARAPKTLYRDGDRSVGYSRLTGGDEAGTLGRLKHPRPSRKGAEPCHAGRPLPAKPTPPPTIRPSLTPCLPFSRPSLAPSSQSRPPR